MRAGDWQCFVMESENESGAEMAKLDDLDPTAIMSERKNGALDTLPKRWWQWVLLYPQVPVAVISALGGLLLGNIPQIIQFVTATRIGVPVAGVAYAQEQEQAWERNAKCHREIEHTKPNTDTNYAIDLLPCPSGDILVTLTPIQSPDRPRYKWIVTKDLFTQQARFSFTTAALAEDARAQPGAPSTVRVIDSTKQGGNIVRRLLLSDNTCIDETVDAFTGRRLDQKSAPCTRF
jgi:hypothetical protein